MIHFSKIKLLLHSFIGKIRLVLRPIAVGFPSFFLSCTMRWGGVTMTSMVGRMTGNTLGMKKGSTHKNNNN